VPTVANNVGTVRKVLAVTLSLAVQAAALSAPLAHAHPDDHTTAHHAGGVVHTHWSGHAGPSHRSDAPEIGTDDHDRAIFLNVFTAVATVKAVDPGVTPGVFELPAPAARAASRRIDVVRSHDPPSAPVRSPRAPPAFLS
jgi:hypothetical protein